MPLPANANKKIDSLEFHGCRDNLTVEEVREEMRKLIGNKADKLTITIEKE